MQERKTLTLVGRQYLDGKISKEEFEEFFENFKTSLKGVLEEYKKDVEPTIYFDPETKRLAEKADGFKALFDDAARGERIIEAGLRDDSKEKFEKGYKILLSVGDEFEKLQGQIKNMSGVN